MKIGITFSADLLHAGHIKKKEAKRQCDYLSRTNGSHLRPP
jgi:hypothetical protein